MDVVDFNGILAGLTQAAAHVHGEDMHEVRVHISPVIDTKGYQGEGGKAKPDTLRLAKRRSICF